MYVPDRNPVKWNGTCLATSNQCCHFSCQPTPSKLTMMNCGGFSPGCSFVGTNPSGRATPCWPVPSPDWVCVVPAGALDDADVAGSELGASGADEEPPVSGLAVTKLVTVWSSAEVELPQAANSSASIPVIATSALRRRATCMNPPSCCRARMAGRRGHGF